MQVLPQYPFPTHDVVVRGVIPLEFEVVVGTFIFLKCLALN